MFHNGSRDAIVYLWAPQGSDNADQWNAIAQSPVRGSPSKAVRGAGNRRSWRSSAGSKRRPAAVSRGALGPRETLRPKQIAFVFQRESLIEPLSVVENVELPLLLAGISPSEARERALDALRLFALDDLREKLPEELSGGQSQRVAFVRALAQRPRLILADEPTGQVDRATADRFLSIAFEELEREDAALVLATHDPRVAARMRTRWQMTRGRLEIAS